ncbi:hypothetical protein Tco_1018042 [Tanacetum coccineum]|uniref:Uncharacterized protein n=1 Tax=Tanacetum coccineum TaxID=301880 RepID=A0ABQ5FVT1_9ASTR
MANVKKSVAERTHHKRQYDRRMEERQIQSRESKVVSSKALDASLVVTECSGTKSDEHITSSSSGTYIIHVVDADIKPVNDQMPSAEVHLTTQHNVLANVQQHTNQSEPSSYHYQEGSLEKTQERNRNSRPSVMHHYLDLQNTANGKHTKSYNACTPKPRNIYRSSPVSKCSGGMSNGVPLVDHSRNSSFFLDSKEFVCSICHKYIFNTNHDDCITKILNKVNSRAKVQSLKIRNNNPVEPKNHTHKPGRQIGIGQRFSLNKSSAVHEKPHTPRSCLRWKPTGRIFKTVSLRWIPTRKMFTDSTTKVDSEPPNGSNDDITNPYECNQTLYFSACTSNSSAVQALFLKVKKGVRLQRKGKSLTEAEEEALQDTFNLLKQELCLVPTLRPMQEDQTGSNSGKFMCHFAGPNP